MTRARRTKGKGSASRQDGFVNRFTGHGTSRDRRTHTRFRADVVTDLEGLDYWRSDDILSRVIELPPREAMRRGFTIKVGDKNGKVISEALQEECDRLDMSERVKFAGQMERACGGAAIMPVLDGAVGDLEEPLDDYEDSILRVDALHVFEPRELMPIAWYTDITSPKFRRPKIYRLQALSGASGRPLSPVPIHESRLVIFPGLRVSSQVLAGQRPGWGDTMVNRVRAVAADFDLSWGSVATLLHDFAQGVLQLGDLAEILSKKGGRAMLEERLAALDMVRSSLRAVLIDAKDKFTRENTPVSGVEGLVVQLAQRVATAADMPATILLGISPAGMNATGDFDIRSWYDRIDGQRAAYRHPIKRLVRLTSLQIDGPCKGEEPEQYSIDFPPLWTPSEKEQADTRLAIAQADQIYHNIGSASSDDISKSRWGGDSFSPEMSIDWDARAKQAALDAAAASLTDEDKAALDAGAGGGRPMESKPVDEGDDEPNVEGESDEPGEPAPGVPGKSVPVAAHRRRVA